jgi:hypothetical protein
VAIFGAPLRDFINSVMSGFACLLEFYKFLRFMLPFLGQGFGGLVEKYDELGKLLEKE